MGGEERKRVHGDVEIADHPIGRLKGGVEVVQDTIQMALQGAAELEEIPLSDMPISTSRGFTEGHGVEWEAV